MGFTSSTGDVIRTVWLTVRSRRDKRHTASSLTLRGSRRESPQRLAPTLACSCERTFAEAGATMRPRLPSIPNRPSAVRYSVAARAGNIRRIACVRHDARQTPSWLI